MNEDMELIFQQFPIKKPSMSKQCSQTLPVPCIRKREYIEIEECLNSESKIFQKIQTSEIDKKINKKNFIPDYFYDNNSNKKNKFKK